MKHEEITYRLLVAYDGTNYSGWQIQPNGITIQELMQQALSTILRKPTFVTGSGRTDAGVHAHGQAAHFHTTQELIPWRLRANLNGLLPKDIRVLEVAQAPATFHARYSATGKVYRYYFDLEEVASPFARHYSWHIPRNFDIAEALATANCFVGTHDFAAFANEAHKREEGRGTVRTVRRLEWHRSEQGLYYFEIEGDGFLYKMVRNLMGFIADVARKKRCWQEIPELMATRDRRRVGCAAPAQGLFLMHVHY